ncbi:MAG: hypothetical protein HRF44_00210 [Ignavibacterium sp.]|jgi:predicted Zn-dependent protease
MERSPFFGLIALLCLVMFPSCGDKPHDPAGKDVWTILWANEVNSDPVGPVGYSMGNFGWYGFYDDYTGYKLDYDFTNINAPSSSILTLETPTKFYNSVYNYVASFYQTHNINASSIDASKTSLLFGIQNIAFRSAGLNGVTSARGLIAQGVAVSFVLTPVILARYSSLDSAWTRVDKVVLHELGHARGLTALDSNNENIDHYTHTVGNTNCVMWQGFISKPFNFCPYHQKVLKNCLTSIQQTYDPAASCATN